MSAAADGRGDPGGQEPPPDELLAAEYVLGVLEAPERLAVEARIAADPAFTVLISAWQRRLAPLAWGLPPVEVPARVWTALQVRLGWISAAAEANTDYGRRLRFWRWSAGIAATAALALLAVDLVPHRPPPTVSESQAAKSVTTLVRDDGSAGWLATVDPSRGSVLMVPVPSAPDAQGRAAELWLIPPGQAPRSLGAVSFSRAHTVEVPRALRADLTGNAVLAITLEPPSGIPHAKPTGPIIAKGAIHL